MMKDIRGFTGIQANSDPIVPIDFELEVDGVAGIFPGNAFQSSYLPEKYKEISCFQTMGVNQKLDSSGWTSTIKGQIRVSVPPGTPPEPEEIPKKKKKEKKVTNDQVVYTQEAETINESFKEQLNNNIDDITVNHGQVFVPGTDLKAAAGEAVLGIGNVSVLTTSSGTSQTHTMVPKTKINKDGSKSTSYRMIKINKE